MGEPEIKDGVSNQTNKIDLDRVVYPKNLQLQGNCNMEMSCPKQKKSISKLFYQSWIRCIMLWSCLVNMAHHLQKKTLFWGSQLRLQMGVHGTCYELGDDPQKSMVVRLHFQVVSTSVYPSQLLQFPMSSKMRTVAQVTWATFLNSMVPLFTIPLKCNSALGDPNHVGNCPSCWLYPILISITTYFLGAFTKFHPPIVFPLKHGTILTHSFPEKFHGPPNKSPWEFAVHLAMAMAASLLLSRSRYWWRHLKSPRKYRMPSETCWNRMEIRWYMVQFTRSPTLRHLLSQAGDSQWMEVDLLCDIYIYIYLCQHLLGISTFDHNLIMHLKFHSEGHSDGCRKPSD